mgnify:CR=1 FL=1
MQITGIQSQGNSSTGVNKQQSEDSIIKNAQSQIEELRKQLQQLAENKDMDPTLTSFMESATSMELEAEIIAPAVAFENPVSKPSAFFAASLAETVGLV